MIAHSRRSTPRLPLTRYFEFTRLETQLLVHAYQALIPIICAAQNSRDLTTVTTSQP